MPKLNIAAIRILFKETMQKKFNEVDLNKVLNNSNNIGSGTEAVCYRIPNMNYVLRVPLDKNSIDISQQIDFNITKQDRINHVVGKIDNCTILKFIEGFAPTRVCRKPSPRLFERLAIINPGASTEDFQKSFKDAWIKCQKEKQLLNIHLPQISKDNIKKYYSQFLNARKNGMLHDDGGDNTLFNIKSGNLTLIDFYFSPTEIKNLLGNPFDSFMNQIGINFIEKERDQNNIVKKALISFFEFLIEHKIPLSEITLNPDGVNSKMSTWKLKDLEFANKVKTIMNSFNSNKNSENVAALIKLLENL